MPHINQESHLFFISSKESFYALTLYSQNENYNRRTHSRRNPKHIRERKDNPLSVDFILNPGGGLEQFIFDSLRHQRFNKIPTSSKLILFSRGP